MEREHIEDQSNLIVVVITASLLKVAFGIGVLFQELLVVRIDGQFIT